MIRAHCQRCLCEFEDARFIGTICGYCRQMGERVEVAIVAGPPPGLAAIVGGVKDVDVLRHLLGSDVSDAQLLGLSVVGQQE